MVLNDLERATAIMGRQPDQLGFVVPDRHAAVSTAVSRLGLHPWMFFEYDDLTLTTRRYRGHVEDFVVHSAVWARGRVSLSQPVSGHSTFADQLADRGPGLHHLGYFVTTIEDAAKTIVADGGEELMFGGGHGIDGDGAFSLLTWGAKSGVLLQLIRPPTRRRLPTRIIDSVHEGEASSWRGDDDSVDPAR